MRNPFRHTIPYDPAELLDSILYDEDSFYKAFSKDLKHALRDVVIESPYLTIRRSETLIPLFDKLTRYDVRVRIDTRHPSHHDRAMCEQAWQAVDKLRTVGVASISPLWFNQNMNHLVIYNKKLFGYDYIAAMLRGDKRLGCKFRNNKAAPYQKLHDGDYLYLKESSGPIRGRVRVTNVQHKTLTEPEEIMDFLVAHTPEIGITNDKQLMEIWKLNANKRYLCSWTMEASEPLEHPVFIRKYDRQTWVVDYEPDEGVLAAFL
jgi:hypothetical protein